ncbi:FAR2 [Symbiodinium natans]|uniref:Fatty acyl-CoA reductase n=1 Tax=Symbiodinium natans TaxID=878477 RepID=A0A812JUL5_9DINO|nr:FAR2 [Symbiodinium natans]
MDLRDFYGGKHVLLTGATGFVGKVLLEKLLWEFCAPCSHYLGPKLHVLIRSQKKSAAQRLEELFDSPAFQRLRARQSLQLRNLEYCLSVVDGDLDSECLGLSSESYDALGACCDVALHCAALVDWAAPLHRSLRSNALGTRRVAQLTAQKPGRLVCVSTAWVHGKAAGPCAEVPLRRSLDPEAEISRCFTYLDEVTRLSTEMDFLEEARQRLGPGPVPTALAEMAETLRGRWVDAEMSRWGVDTARARGWWDGYTFSKAIGEMLVQDVQGVRPYAVVRPSGVVSAWAEPMPGWVDAYLLVEPLIEGMGRGQITEFPGRRDCVIDCVPVDYVCNVVLAAAGCLPAAPVAPESCPARVYQVASGDVSPNTLGEIESTWREYFKSQPMHNQGRPVEVRPVKFLPSADDFVSSLQRRYLTPLRRCLSVLELLPVQHMAPLRDGRAWLKRKHRSLEKLTLLARLYSTYTLNEWSFQTPRTRELMAQVDSVRFPYFPEKPWTWRDFWTQKHIPGMRQWVLKESQAVSHTVQAVNQGNHARL